jgi:hypothetical protein
LRLAETVRRLTTDRDKVLARLDTLERNIDVTGSIHEGATVRDATATRPVAPPSPAATSSSKPEPTSAASTSQVASLPSAQAASPTEDTPGQRPGAIAPFPTTLLAPPSPPTSTTPVGAAPQPAPTPQTAPTPVAAEPAKPIATVNPAADSVATRTEFGVDLGGDRTVDALRALWTSLRAGRHASLFTGLRPLVAIREVGKSGAVELRLVVGPVANAGAAARLCGTLAAQGLACQPTVFDGQRLALR